MLETQRTRRFDSIEQEAYLAIWRTYDRLRSYDEAVFEQFGLTAQQYNLLRLLRADSPRPVPTLSLVSRMVSRAPDITRMLDRLEADGWIERQRSVQDRRAVLVGITQSGIELLKKISRPLSDCHEKQLGHLSKSDLKTLCRLLEKARQPHEPPESPWR